MTDILVVNHGLHEVCGVHDIGRRLYDAIPDSIDKAYVESTSAANLAATCEDLAPRVALVNYRADLMGWLHGALPPGVVTVAVAHNYEPHTLAALHSRHAAAGFQATLALEPRLYDLDGIVWSGRPLPPPVRAMRAIPTGRPMIGSFGFAFGHKRFDLVAREVVALGKPAVFRLHCPTAHFGGSQEHTDAVIASVRAELVSSDVNLVATMDHRPTLGVVRMLAANDVNCLLYDPGQPDAGLSSALDYLLAAGRPVLVSQASMFRHALPAAAVWPDCSLADVLANADRHAINVRERADQLSAGYADGIERLLEGA